jgi:hypothetical protein
MLQFSSPFQVFQNSLNPNPQWGKDMSTQQGRGAPMELTNRYSDEVSLRRETNMRQGQSPWASDHR